MGVLKDYLDGLAGVQRTGEAVEETSYYGQLEKLLNAIGHGLAPKVVCVLTTRNRGAGVPDGGFFIASRAVSLAGKNALVARAPERGVVEVKGPGQDVRKVAHSQQVRRYLGRYGKVLVCTYREFLVLGVGHDGQPVEGEHFSLAPDQETFWGLAAKAKGVDEEQETAFADYLRRALHGDAPLTSAADLAWFLAAYAREGKQRLENIDPTAEALTTLRSALEDALGLRFEKKEGDQFFRAALVQTLFYGVFASWVVWSESQPKDSTARFSWKSAQWTLNVPMVRVLFQQLASPATLPAGLDEVLDWTEDVLARVDREPFFKAFETGSAVQYFYEPFLHAYDPDLRRDLGVWYTPPEIVRYMVGRAHEALKRDLGLPLGLADKKVQVLDPCAGTGSFLVEAIRTIASALEAEHGDGLVAQEAKAAALSRVHGFELLPAPFVVAHLQVGLALDSLGASLDVGAGERARIYLTNGLTGWVESDEHPALPFPEFEQERDAAEAIKRETPILVVMGNPPYNGFAGVSGTEEGGLVEPYKDGLAEKWDITKNKLDDLYIRFFRVAERRITEQTGKGIVCFISNFSWLGDPSAVVMRQRLVSEFDRIYIDNLNGDSRETGKKTPDGDPDPSVFSTKLNPAGIQVGTAVSLLVRNEQHEDRAFVGGYRDFWGVEKREAVEASLAKPNEAPEYEPLLPDETNWYRLRRWAPRRGYEGWPSIPDLAAEDPLLGMNENRGEALISHERAVLVDRMNHYLDAGISDADLNEPAAALMQPWSGFKATEVRRALLGKGALDEKSIVRLCVKPFDVRYAYVDTTPGLWNRSRPELVKAAELGSDFLVLRRRAPRALDGAAFLLSRCLIDQHVMHKDAYVIPFCLAADSANEDEGARLFAIDERPDDNRLPWRPNLSERAMDYLGGLGIHDTTTSRSSAQLLWRHVLAIGYSPLYLEENGDAIRNNWARVPLPDTQDELLASARLGETIADLLDVDKGVRGVDTSVLPRLRHVARIERVDGEALNPGKGDLAVGAGWGVEQMRKQKSGAVSRLVMPAAGRVEVRQRTDEERKGLADDELELLGDEVVDVYLNNEVCWRGIPESAWDYKVGGFQVLRKWLSYRDKRILQRDLRVAEARQFTSICRRLTEVSLLGPRLDANYVSTAFSLDQEALPV